MKAPSTDGSSTLVKLSHDKPVLDLAATAPVKSMQQPVQSREAAGHCRAGRAAGSGLRHGGSKRTTT